MKNEDVRIKHEFFKKVSECQKLLDTLEGLMNSHPENQANYESLWGKVYNIQKEYIRAVDSIDELDRVSEEVYKLYTANTNAIVEEVNNQITEEPIQEEVETPQVELPQMEETPEVVENKEEEVPQVELPQVEETSEVEEAKEEPVQEEVETPQIELPQMEEVSEVVENKVEEVPQVEAPNIEESVKKETPQVEVTPLTESVEDVSNTEKESYTKLKISIDGTNDLAKKISVNEKQKTKLDESLTENEAKAKEILGIKKKKKRN